MESEFKPNQCDHITNGSKYPLTDHLLYECAKLDQENCIFYKRCAFVKEVSESWAFNEFRTLKNNESMPAFSFSYCWRNIPNDTEYSFISWDPKTKSCSWSNEKTEVCLSKAKTIPIFRNSKCNVTIINPDKYKGECRDTENTVEFGDPDPLYSCAIKNENHTSITFYMHYEYNIWNEIVMCSRNTYWMWTCVVICAFNILIGGPTLIYFHKHYKPIMEDDAQSNDKSAIKAFDIPSDMFRGYHSSKHFPKSDEWTTLIQLDVKLNVLKYSSGYATKFTHLNRYECTLESRINVAPGTFGKNNKHSPLNKRSPLLK